MRRRERRLASARMLTGALVPAVVSLGFFLSFPSHSKQHGMAIPGTVVQVWPDFRGEGLRKLCGGRRGAEAARTQRGAEGTVSKGAHSGSGLPRRREVSPCRGTPPTGTRSAPQRAQDGARQFPTHQSPPSRTPPRGAPPAGAPEPRHQASGMRDGGEGSPDLGRTSQSPQRTGGQFPGSYVLGLFRRRTSSLLDIA